MFLTKHISSNLENLINNFYIAYRDEIIALHKKQWKEEDIKEWSCKVYQGFDYYAAFYLVLLMFLEMNEGLETSKDYYEGKYQLSKIRNCLACKGIDLDDIMTIFGMTFETGNGINFMQIEKTFVIEPLSLTSPIKDTQDIQDLIDNPFTCENLLNEDNILTLVEVSDDIDNNFVIVS